MKTQEFIEGVRKLGYMAEREYKTRYEYITITYRNDEDEFVKVAAISAKWEAWGYIYGLTVSGGNEMELMQLILDYFNATLEERGEEKAHHYKIKGLSPDHSYINLDVVTGTLFTSTKVEGTLMETKTKFTKSEIKRMPEEQQELFKFAKREEVEQ